MDLEQLITSREAEFSKAGQGAGWGDALQALDDWPVPADARSPSTSPLAEVNVASVGLAKPRSCAVVMPKLRRPSSSRNAVSAAALNRHTTLGLKLSSLSLTAPHASSPPHAPSAVPSPVPGAPRFTRRHCPTPNPDRQSSVKAVCVKRLAGVSGCVVLVEPPGFRAGVEVGAMQCLGWPMLANCTARAWRTSGSPPH
jgi:hypothetical protein